MVAQSAQLLQFFGGNVGMVLEVFGQHAVNLDVADFCRSLRVHHFLELGATQPAQELLLCPEHQAPYG